MSDQNTKNTLVPASSMLLTLLRERSRLYETRGIEPTTVHMSSATCDLLKADALVRGFAEPGGGELLTIDGLLVRVDEQVKLGHVRFSYEEVSDEE